MGLCFRLTVMQWQNPTQTAFVKVHRHLFFIRRMLGLKAFPWHSATTTQLLLRSHHRLDKQYVVRMVHWLMVALCPGKSSILTHITKRRVGLPGLHTQRVEKEEL